MAYSWPVTINDVRDDLNITDSSNDAELQTIIDAATAMLENHPGYTVADRVKTTTYTEWYDGGIGRIVLNHYPVSSIISVTEYNGTAAQAIAAEPWDSVTFTAYGYVLGTSGFLDRTASGYPVHFTGRVKVVYVAGTDEVPADLRLAALLLVEHLWQTQRGDQGPTLDGLDAVSPDFRSSFALPNRVLEILAPYAKGSAVA